VTRTRPHGETQDYPGRDERDAQAGSRHPPPSGGADCPSLPLHGVTEVSDRVGSPRVQQTSFQVRRIGAIGVRLITAADE